MPYDPYWLMNVVQDGINGDVVGDAGDAGRDAVTQWFWTVRVLGEDTVRGHPGMDLLTDLTRYDAVQWEGVLCDAMVGTDKEAERMNELYDMLTAMIPLTGPRTEECRKAAIDSIGRARDSYISLRSLRKSTESVMNGETHRMWDILNGMARAVKEGTEALESVGITESIPFEVREIVLRAGKSVWVLCDAGFYGDGYYRVMAVREMAKMFAIRDGGLNLGGICEEDVTDLKFGSVMDVMGSQMGRPFMDPDDLAGNVEDIIFEIATNGICLYMDRESMLESYGHRMWPWKRVG